MQRLAARSWIAAAVALVGVSAIAATPVAMPLPGSATAEILLTAQDITLDLVRHGQSVDNAEGVLGTTPPGAELTAVGEQEVADVAPEIQAAFPNGIDGLYASELIRAQDTAQPLAELLHMDVTTLSGLNELSAGWREGQPLNAFTEFAYIAAPIMWILGQYWAPQLGSAVDPNGAAFDDRVSEAIQAMYANTVADPANPMNDVAFTHAGAIAVWTLMNVKNPDFGLVINELIDTHYPVANTGQVVIEGNPIDGWTLVSWDGHAVPATPDLFTGLFVDWRDLTTAPQIASWHSVEALQSGGQADVAEVLQTGFDQVVGVLGAFPQSVIDTVTAALSG